MENKKRKSYESPQLTVVSFKTERGYQASAPLKLGEFLLLTEDQPAKQMESYIARDDWNEGNDNHFWY